MNSEQLYASTTFPEFWEHYQAMHERRSTQVAHTIATTSAIGMLVLAYARRSPLIALAAPLVDYAISQLSHRVFERNATHPYRKPIWHARAELRMWRRTISDLGRFV